MNKEALVKKEKIAVGIYLQKDLYERLRQESIEQERSMSSLIRFLLAQASSNNNINNKKQ